MCASMNCLECPLEYGNNGKMIRCTTIITENPKEAEEIIMKWAKENPIKTNAEKFKEVFGITWNEAPIGCRFWNQEYKEPEEV